MRSVCVQIGRTQYNEYLSAKSCGDVIVRLALLRCEGCFGELRQGEASFAATSL